MAHLALHFPVVKRKSDSSCRLELRELKELPDRLVFAAIFVLHLLIAARGGLKLIDEYIHHSVE
jgi:hypothetical protein